MTILGINRVFNSLVLLSGRRRYSCITKKIGRKDYFYFKKKWHKVGDYLNDFTDEFVKVGKKYINRKIKK